MKKPTLSPISEPLWQAMAAVLAWPPIARRLIARSRRTPYFAITKGGSVYMDRHWLFNPYDNETRNARHRWCPVSVRVHHIQRPDDDRNLHDHPWNARTIILAGDYIEEVPGIMPGSASLPARRSRQKRIRRAGDTARIGYGKFHRIAEVSEGGVYTLFISGRNRGTWGFLVDGVKVPWRQYLGTEEAAE